MKKIITIALALFSLSAFAENEFSYTTNKAGGYMFFTYSDCINTKTGAKYPDYYYVYSSSDSGKKIADGCYRAKAPFYLIEWNGGGTTNINFNSVNLMNK